MYNSGVIPTDLKPIYIHNITKEVKGLMSHITKLLLKVIEQRIVKKIDNEVSRLQSGFRTGSGTREGIFNL